MKKKINTLRQHKIEIENNRKIWKKKKLIREIYSNYFRMLINEKKKGSILEIGSGMGNIKKIEKDVITSDLFKNINIDKVEDIYNLSFKSNKIDNIIFIDVLHHIEFPKNAFEEMHRILKKNGRVVMLEPSMGLIPRLIFKLFHHEPNGFNFKLNWFKKKNITKRYFAAQSIPWRLFVLKEKKLTNFKIRKISLFSDFKYLASGGFSHKSFYPYSSLYFIKLLDKLLTLISSKLFSARMLVVLEK